MTDIEKYKRHRFERIIVGCGLEFDEFNPLYDALSKENRDAINRVSWRLLQTYLLRYDVGTEDVLDAHRDIRPDYTKWFFNSATPSLEIYLLFTCLDTLAGVGHQDFIEWLGDKLGDEKISKTEIDEYHKKYKKEHGVTSNLGKLFSRLPDTTKDWLAYNTIFRKVPKSVYGIGEFDSKRYDKLSENPEFSSQEKIANLLFQYFYKHWRNKFTHNSITRAPYISVYVTPTNNVLSIPPIYTVINLEELSSNPNISLPPRPNRSGQLVDVGKLKISKSQYWQMFLSPEIDEALILRVIIQSYIFQLLGIGMTSVHLDKFLNGLYFQCALRGYAQYTKKNMNLMTEFKKLGNEEQSNNLFCFDKLPLLNISWSEELLALFDGREGAGASHVKEYCLAAKSINKKIDTFNSSMPPNNEISNQVVQEFCAELFTNLSPKLINMLMGNKQKDTAS